MVSKQQTRLLLVYLLAFGLLTVPVILVLINFVSPEDINKVGASVIKNRSIIDSPANLVNPEKILSQTDLYLENKTTASTDDTAMSRSFIAGNWVVVDCERRIVLQCPHRLINQGSSPRFGGSNEIFQSHCRDVNIKLDSFCIL